MAFEILSPPTVIYHVDLPAIGTTGLPSECAEHLEWLGADALAIGGVCPVHRGARPPSKAARRSIERRLDAVRRSVPADLALVLVVPLMAWSAPTTADELERIVGLAESVGAGAVAFEDVPIDALARLWRLRRWMARRKIGLALIASPAARPEHLGEYLAPKGFDAAHDVAWSQAVELALARRSPSELTRAAHRPCPIAGTLIASAHGLARRPLRGTGLDASRRRLRIALALGRRYPAWIRAPDELGIPHHRSAAIDWRHVGVTARTEGSSSWHVQRLIDARRRLSSARIGPTGPVASDSAELYAELEAGVLQLCNMGRRQTSAALTIPAPGAWVTDVIRERPLGQVDEHGRLEYVVEPSDAMWLTVSRRG